MFSRGLILIPYFMIRCIWRFYNKLKVFLKHKLIDYIEYISQIRYEIGFPTNSLESILEGNELDVKWLKHKYRDRWFADPFILDSTETHIVLLVEEFFYDNQKGRIAKLTINKKNYKIVKNETLLELKTHLSFPAIIRRGSDVFIYPENSENGCLIAYNINTNYTRVKPFKTIIETPLTDAIIHDWGMHTFLFSTKLPDPNGKELIIYKKDDSENEYKLFEKITFIEKVARNAGDFFSLNGDLYRPAQECNKVYGHCVILQKVSLVNESFLFKEICRLYSSHKLMKDGLHTFNTYKGVHVIDVNGCKHPYIKKIFDSLYICYKNLHFR